MRAQSAHFSAERSVIAPHYTRVKLVAAGGVLHAVVVVVAVLMKYNVALQPAGSCATLTHEFSSGCRFHEKKGNCWKNFKKITLFILLPHYDFGTVVFK